VLVAIGFTGPQPELLDELGIERDDHGRVRHSEHATTAPGVFVAGDAHVGPSLTVTALNEGLRCARTVHRWLARGAGDGWRRASKGEPRQTAGFGLA
jgi:glutamate synthase (NADPH/NADH) small chain